MRCFVINLDRSRDRLAHVTAEFDRIGVAFERIAAIDAWQRQDLSQVLMHAGKMPWRLSGSETACLLSHRACWSKLAAGDDAYGAIFEDDVVFAAKAGPLLADGSWIPANAEIVKLETFLHRTKVGLRSVAAGHGFSASRLHAVHIGSAGYIVSKQAAGALLSATEKIDVPVDHVLFNPAVEPVASKVVYQLRPALCVQEEVIARETARFPSLLSQDREEHRVLNGLRNPELSTLDRIKREFGRVFRQVADLCRLRRSLIVPFEQQSRRVRAPHTQRRENAL